MLTFKNKYANNIVHSQFGEEGIIQECLKRMGITDGRCVEIGANNGAWCSNTALLIKQGFKALMIEGDLKLFNECQELYKDDESVVCIHSMVTGLNVNDLVTGDDIDVFSTDTDGDDYGIFNHLECRPKIVIIEIDSSIHPKSHALFNSDGGSAYRPMVELGESKGYFLLCHTANLIFVRNDFKALFPDIILDPIIDWELYFDKSHLK